MVELNDKELRRQLDKITKALQEIKKSGAKKVMRKATRAAAKVIVPVAKALAPVASGALRKSIKVRSLARSRVWVGTNLRLGNSEKLGQGKQFYGSFQELGWKTGKRGSQNRKEIKGRGFLKAAYDQTKQKALATAIDTARFELASYLTAAKGK